MLRASKPQYLKDEVGSEVPINVFVTQGYNEIILGSKSPCVLTSLQAVLQPQGHLVLTVSAVSVQQVQLVLPTELLPLFRNIYVEVYSLWTVPGTISALVCWGCLASCFQPSFEPIEFNESSIPCHANIAMVFHIAIQDQHSVTSRILAAMSCKQERWKVLVILRLLLTCER